MNYFIQKYFIQKQKLRKGSRQGSTMSYTAGLYTLGCKVSQYETESIAEALERLGFEILPFEARCDLYVINTCTVTAEADRKSRQFIRRAISANPNAALIVTGCYSQINPDLVREIDGISYLCGNAGKSRIAEEGLRLVRLRESGVRPESCVSVGDITQELYEETPITRSPRTRAYVKIEDGCDCACTYCIISRARGNVRSRAASDIIDELNRLSAVGVREAVLVGIETASYGRDLGDYRLAELLADIEANCDLDRIRLGSLTPQLFTEKFVSKISGLSRLTPHFHISMQSASDPVLRAMKRRYNVEMAERGISLLREAIPDVMFTGDFICGFPGETDADASATEDFVRRVRFLDTHVFAYSKRKGTPAAAMPDQVPEALKKSRSESLIRLSRDIRRELLCERVASGAPLSVLFEDRQGDFARGHSPEFIEVRVPLECEAFLGRIVSVLPERVDGGVIYGRPI